MTKPKTNRTARILARIENEVRAGRNVAACDVGYRILKICKENGLVFLISHAPMKPDDKTCAYEEIDL